MRRLIQMWLVLGGEALLVMIAIIGTTPTFGEPQPRWFTLVPGVGGAIIIATLLYFVYLARKDMQENEKRYQRERQENEKRYQRERQENEKRYQRELAERRAKAEVIRQQVLDSPEFQLTREVAAFLGKPFDVAKEPNLYGTLSAAFVHVRDADTQRARKVLRGYMVKEGTAVTGWGPLRKLYEYLMVREPQPALQLFLELVSANAGALHIAVHTGIDTATYQKQLKARILYFSTQILDLCLSSSGSVCQSHSADPPSQPVIVSRIS